VAKCKTCGAPVNLAPDGDPKFQMPFRAARPNWILCADKMPPFNKTVLTYWPGDKKKNPVYKINERPGRGQIGNGRWWTSRPAQEPTHWAELVGPKTNDKEPNE
jgi:hypothetical protein